VVACSESEIWHTSTTTVVAHDQQKFLEKSKKKCCSVLRFFKMTVSVLWLSDLQNQFLNDIRIPWQTWKSSAQTVFHL